MAILFPLTLELLNEYIRLSPFKPIAGFRRLVHLIFTILKNLKYEKATKIDFDSICFSF